MNTEAQIVEHRSYIEPRQAVERIKKALRERSGKAWSVTMSRGSSWGWITINAPPARRTAHWRLKAGETVDLPENYERVDTGKPDGAITPADQAELAALLGMPMIHFQGVSIPASNDYHWEFVDRAEGRTPEKLGEKYWD